MNIFEKLRKENEDNTTKNAYKIKPVEYTKEYDSKIRVLNKKYNSLGVTIPKQVAKIINLQEGDLLHFEVQSVSDNRVDIEISFRKKID